MQVNEGRVLKVYGTNTGFLIGCGVEYSLSITIPQRSLLVEESTLVVAAAQVSLPTKKPEDVLKLPTPCKAK